MFDADKDMQKELKVDQMIKKLRTLEGIIREEMDDIKWRSAYDRYSLYSVKAKNYFERSPRDANERRSKFTGKSIVPLQEIESV